jgi:hypothetical protein
MTAVLVVFVRGMFEIETLLGCQDDEATNAEIPTGDDRET